MGEEDLGGAGRPLERGSPYPPNLPDPPLTFLPTATAQTALSVCIAGLDAVRSIGKDWVAVARKVISVLGGMSPGVRLSRSFGW